MSFLHPIFAWTFAALLPLALLYLLKTKPRVKHTTAFFLWERILAPDRRSALFQRLRDVFSLLLMLAAFSLIALALMEPRLGKEEVRNLLIIVDQSASMQTREGGLTRLALAQERATDIVRGLRGSQMAAIAGMAHEVAFIASPTRHQRSLLDAIEQLQATEMPLDGESLLSFLSVGARQQGTRVLFVTDGCSAEMSRIAERCEVIRIGSPVENVGIIAADLRPSDSGGRGLRLFLRVTSSFKAALATEISITKEEHLVKVLPLELAAGKEVTITLDLPEATAGRYVAELGAKDAFALDDRAYLVVPESKPVPVAVESTEPFFYQNAILAFAEAQEALRYVKDPAEAEITLASRKAPTAKCALIFQPEGESPWWQQIGSVVAATPKAQSKHRDHALMRWLDAEGINFAGARELRAPPGAHILVESDEGLPLIYLVREPEKSAVVVNLDPAESSFYLSAWFPILVRNAAAVLGGRAEPQPVILKTGSVLTGEAKLAEKIGFYASASPQWSGGASLLDAAESSLDGSSVKETLQPLTTSCPWSYGLAALALCIVAVESALYHRRKVG